MAKKTQVILTCDLHESGADAQGDVEEITFGLDGATYEIDACAEHAEALRDAFAPYVGAARRVGRPSGGGGGTARRAPRSNGRPAAASSGTADRDRVQAIREWARENGHKVSERGRLSASVLAAYEAAH